MKPLANQPQKENRREHTRKMAKIVSSLILAGSLATGGLSAAGCESCPLPGSCDTRTYPVDLHEGERIETVSGQYPIRLEILDITNETRLDLTGRCEAVSGRSSARLSIFPTGTTDLGSTAPIHTQDIPIYPGSCIAIWDYCIRIEGREAPVEVTQNVTVDPVTGVATTNCAVSNERIKFAISLNRGRVETPDGGYFTDGGSGGTGGSGSDTSSGGTGGP